MKYTMNYKNSALNIDTEKGTLSGNTFAAKEWIKENFSGIRWNSENKNWTMSPEEMTARIESMKAYFVRVASLTEAKAETTVIAHIHHLDTLCPICHTYCNGDCTAAK